MDDPALRAQILAIITERTALGERTTIGTLQERFKGRLKYHVRREAERLSKQGLIQSRKGGYAALPIVDRVDSTAAARTAAGFEIPLHRLMAGR